jgi:ubiquinone/menaquinone biosynthesis C-methylase UbiE
MSECEAWQVTDDAAVLYEQSFVPAIFAQSAVTLADAAAIGRGDRVLDVGCGTGVVAREAVRRIGAEGRVTGLDLNPRMLEVARRVAPEIEWRQGDAADLPFEDGAFDVVISQFALMFFPDAVSALREMSRVLAARGRLAVAVCGPLAATPGYAALGEVAKRVCSPEVVDLLRSPFALGDKERLAGLVRDAGIDGAEIETHYCTVRFPSIDALVHTEVKASPIRDVIDARSFDALLQGARENLARLCVEGEEVVFAMPAHIVTARKA